MGAADAAPSATHGIEPVSYDDDVHPYTDLAARPRRRRAARQRHRRARHAAAAGPRHATRRRGHRLLRGAAGARADGAARPGRTRRCGRRWPTAGSRRSSARWDVWNDDQPRDVSRACSAAPTRCSATPDAPGAGGAADAWTLTRRYLPALLRAAVITLVLSCAAMLLAVALGAAIAIGRVYGARWVRAALDRLRRGDARHAGAAAALRALLRPGRRWCGCRRSSPRCSAWASTTRPTRARSTARRSRRCRAGQLEAARTLGFSRWQTLRLIRGPQAFRYALAPMTNDFVALLKDSSLVSVLTVVELTKQTQIFAANLGTWAIPGALCAATLPGDVVAAGAARAAARTALEGAHAHDRRPCSASTACGCTRGTPRDPARRRPRRSARASWWR